MDGVGTPDDHAKRSAELGYSAQAVTEHGNVSSHVGHEKAAKKYGIKPLFGLEAYTHPEPDSRRKFHLTLLAQNQVGYQNLMQAVSQTWAEGFHQWPTMSGQMLADNSDGLIVMSGCSDSLLACSLLGGKTIEPVDASWKRALNVASAFKELLGDRYYLECQMFPELPRTHAINEAYERMSKKLKIPLVGTADVHYPHPDDNDLQILVHAAGRGNNTAAKQAESWEYDIRLTHPVSDDQAVQRLRETGLSRKAAEGAWLGATAEIAERCTVVLPKADRFRWELLEGETSLELIWEWLREGWRYRVEQGNTRIAAKKTEYLDRIKMEMDLIASKDFVDYFLLTSDIIRSAKDVGEPVGPARGSSAASLVCYLLRITEIDPLQYPLMYFSRFISPDRVDVPDIDTDFADDTRPNVTKRAVAKYGSNRVANIATFTKYKGKNSIDDVARVHSIPPFEADIVKSMVLERSGGDSRADASLEDTINTFAQAKEIFEKYPALYKAIRLEGNYRGMSTHAAGLVVTNSPISDVCAIYTRDAPGEAGKRGEKLTAVSVNKYDAEYVNLMKVDILSLSTLGMIRIALEAAGVTLEELYRVPMDEPATMEAFRRNDVVGIFQFEGRATRMVCREVKPDNFMELADINGLSRPGPLFSGTTTEYIKTKWGDMDRVKFHPVVDQHTEFTKGQVIYQEQVLAVLGEFGGLPINRVHDIRKIISQKLGQGQFQESEQEFIDGAARLHGASPELAKKVWGRLVTSATYSFNIAHCISYSMLAFWCMWLKVHHPTAFYTAQLRKTKPDKWDRLIKDAMQHGIDIRGVTLGESETDWSSPYAGRVVAGYSQLNGVGAVTAERIQKKLVDRGRPFERVDDLLEVPGIGPATLEKFRTQIETDDPFGIKHMIDTMANVRNWLKESPGLPQPNFNSDQLLAYAGETRCTFLGLVVERNYQDVVENKRSRTGLAVEEIIKDLKHPHLTTAIIIRAFDEGDEDVYLRFNRFTYPKMKAMIDGIRVGHDLLLIRGFKSNRVSAVGISVQVDWMTVIDPDD